MFAILFKNFEPPQHSLKFWWYYTFMYFLGGSVPGKEVILTSNYSYILYGIGKILSMLLPSLFFGLIVFKVFIPPKIITFKKKCNIFMNDSNQPVLAIRFYSSTKLRLINIDLKVTARFTKLREDQKTHFIKNVDLNLKNNSWKLAVTHVPFTIYIPLEESDFNYETKEISHIQGKDFTDCTLLVSLNGKCPDLNSEFQQFHNYKIPNDLDWSRFNDIDSKDYSMKSVNWDGWSDFDM